MKTSEYSISPVSKWAVQERRVEVDDNCMSVGSSCIATFDSLQHAEAFVRAMKELDAKQEAA